MRALFASLLMLAAGLLAAGGFSGTSQLPDVWQRVWSGAVELHPASLALGTVLGFALAHGLLVPWRQLPTRLVGWFFSKRGKFRLMGYGAAFLAVLLFF